MMVNILSLKKKATFGQGVQTQWQLDEACGIICVAYILCRLGHHDKRVIRDEVLKLIEARKGRQLTTSEHLCKMLLEKLDSSTVSDVSDFNSFKQGFAILPTKVGEYKHWVVVEFTSKEYVLFCPYSHTLSERDRARGETIPYVFSKMELQIPFEHSIRNFNTGLLIKAQ